MNMRNILEEQFVSQTEEGEFGVSEEIVDNGGLIEKNNTGVFDDKSAVSYRLSEETKKAISETVGLSFEEIVNMDPDELDSYIEQKTGKKLTYARPSDRFITGEQIDAELDKMDKFCTGGRQYTR